MNAKKNSQAGFSLIELLVVVAIIGVLAAAGMVGYSSYLNGAKTDTQKNNAVALAQALKTTAAARIGGLTGVPPACSGGTFSLANDTSSTAAGSPLNCLQSLASEGGFASPYSKNIAGSSYISSASGCGSTPNMLVLSGNSTGGFIIPCDDKGAALTSGTSVGKDW